MIEEYKKLVEQIKYHNDRYYNQDKPEITDYEYDMLMKKLKEIEKKHPEYINENSPTQKVGGLAKREAGVLVKHRVPMLSLQDVFSKEEVFNFVDDMYKVLDNPTFVVERKIDGLSMALRYEDGELKTAITRGDGITYGEDVTANARVIKDVKKKLKDKIPYLELRGEVYMTEESFNNVNENQELLGKKTFANPRNCAAGTLRQLDSKVTKQRNLSLFIFNIQDSNGIEFSSHTEGYDWLKKQGIKVIENYKVCVTKEEVWDAIQQIGENRGSFGYDIDGAVVKIDEFTDRQLLGNTSKVPKWAVAYKYPPEEKETVIKDIELSVGRTGRITPTAIFDTVRLCGTNVERATLHNQDFIDNLDIRIGDTVLVYKSGDIIPKIKSVVLSKRSENAEKYTIPGVCPVCGSPAVREEDNANIVCTGTNCPAQLERHLINFVSRDAMDIKGFGTAYIVELIKQGYIKNIADIYFLKDYRDELIEKGIIGKEKNTDKLLGIIEKSKENEPNRLLVGFGITNVGKSTAKAIIKHFKSIDNIMQATVEDLKEVNDIGEISAISIVKFFENEENRKVITTLKKAGVNMSVLEDEIIGTKLEGLIFVVTGTLPNLSRSEATEIIQNNGGKVSSSVSKKTSYLLAGENAGSKLTKAQNLGIKIITENELKDMVK